MKKPFAIISVAVALAGFALGQAPTAASVQAGNSKQMEGPMVKYFSKNDLTAAFAKGATIADQNNYKVMTAHRNEGGLPEAHKNFTDIFYIVQGETTVIVGGKMVGDTGKNADEPRGTSIDGGETFKMAAGDSIIIPAGVPHWMKEVKGELHYYVIKVKNE
jgi:mannose-6-phosphate isomerase-like protein (cupin superfamily)